MKIQAFQIQVTYTSRLSHMITSMSKISNLHLQRPRASKDNHPCSRRARRRLSPLSRRSRSPNVTTSCALSSARGQARRIWKSESLVRSPGALPELGASSSQSQGLRQTPRMTFALSLDKSAWYRMELPSHQLHLSKSSRNRCPKMCLL